VSVKQLENEKGKKGRRVNGGEEKSLIAVLGLFILYCY